VQLSQAVVTKLNARLNNLQQLKSILSQDQSLSFKAAEVDR
jgi:hypothetical protein